MLLWKTDYFGFKFEKQFPLGEKLFWWIFRHFSAHILETSQRWILIRMNSRESCVMSETHKIVEDADRIRSDHRSCFEQAWEFCWLSQFPKFRLKSCHTVESESWVGDVVLFRGRVVQWAGRETKCSGFCEILWVWLYESLNLNGRNMTSFGCIGRGNKFPGF